MTMQHCVRLPTHWIENRGLATFDWYQGERSCEIAALMVLIALAHRADPESGAARLTYDAIADATTLSRTMISRGLRLLESRNIVKKSHHEQSRYQLLGYERDGGWGMLPARPLYEGLTISPFKDFHLRQVTELHALKAYLAFVARRDRNTNFAHMTYSQIEEYSRIPRNRIKSAISLLATHNLGHVEHMPRADSEHGIASAYRLAHIESRRHMGTTGRRQILDTLF